MPVLTGNKLVKSYQLMGMSIICGCGLSAMSNKEFDDDDDDDQYNNTFSFLLNVFLLWFYLLYV